LLYHDRLGTNIGKALKTKEHYRLFMQALTETDRNFVFADYQGTVCVLSLCLSRASLGKTIASHIKGKLRKVVQGNGAIVLYGRRVFVCVPQA